LRGRLQNEDRAANDPSLPVDDRRAALSAANSIRNFLAQLGVPEGGGTSRAAPANRQRSNERNIPPRPPGISENEWRFLTPEERALWQN